MEHCCWRTIDDQMKLGGIVNDIHKFDVNKIDIKASSAAINEQNVGKFS